MRRTTTVVSKKLAVLFGMLAVLLAAAVPALAQEDAAGQYGGTQYTEVPVTATATGVLGRAAPHSPDPEPVYSITDEATGTPYELISGFVELESFVGQRVTIEGGEVPGSLPPGSPVFLNVTTIVSAEDPSEGPEVSVRGTVTDISGSVVLVEEDPSAESGDKGLFAVTDATEITLRRDGGSVAAAFGDLAVGQTVEASYAGPVAESYPTQGNAATIAIVEDFDCPVVGGCKDPGQSPNEVSVTGVIGPLADNADAEHGITDEATGTFYALTSSAVDLDAYANGGQRLNVYGTRAQTLVATEYPILEVSRVEVLDGTQQPPPPPPGDVATFTYELAVECEPPEGAEFFGFVATESAVTAPLTDPDGDGVYSGSLKTPKFAPGGSRDEPVTISPVRIVQGPPAGAGPSGPEYRVVKDFGAVKAEDTTLSASVSFCDGENPPPPEEEVSATGIVEELEAEPVVVDGVEICGLPTHAITDEATGRYYDLTSDAVDLDEYAGKRVAVTGTLLASPAIEGAQRCPDLNVTRAKLLDGAGGSTPPPADSPAPGADVDGNGTVDASDGEEAARVSDSAKTDGGARVLPNTSGSTLALVAGAGVLLTAAGLLVRRTTR